MNAMNAETVAALACCRCAAALNAFGDGLACDGCGRTYPILGGIPCLVPEPVQFQLAWHGRLAEYRSMIDAALSGVAAEREREDLSARTRERLMRLTGGMQVMQRSVEALLAPVVAGAETLPLPRFPARTGPEVALSVLHHYENVFRDWAWGGEENERQRSLVENLLPPGGLPRLAVYGAGAGRLAADLHARRGATQTFALDLNPLPLAVGHELMLGSKLELAELPVAPRSEAQVAVIHRLEAARAAEGLTFLFADALEPPFAPGSLDAVLTPWFIDVVGVELAATATAINRVLRKGGLWLNLGPLLFKGSIAGQHAIAETLDIVRENGFDVLSHGSDEGPYFRSPHSASFRVETQYWFSAAKTADAPAAREHATLAPTWLQDPRLPVPVLPQLAELHRASLFTVGVLSMVDGQTSVADMAARLAQSWNADPATVENHLRAFFGAAVDYP